jgi:hypothetical protein
MAHSSYLFAEKRKNAFTDSLKCCTHKIELYILSAKKERQEWQYFPSIGQSH